MKAPSLTVIELPSTASPTYIWLLVVIQVVPGGARVANFSS